MIELRTGIELKKWRESNHLSQQQLADCVRYSVGRISHIESANESLSKRLLERVEQLDIKLHPRVPGEKILKKWNELEEYRNIFGKDFDEMESRIVELITPELSSRYFYPHLFWTY